MRRKERESIDEATGSFKKMGFRSYSIYPEGVCVCGPCGVSGDECLLGKEMDGGQGG